MKSIELDPLRTYQKSPAEYKTAQRAPITPRCPHCRQVMPIAPTRAEKERAPVTREDTYGPPASPSIAEPEIIRPTERISTGQASPPAGNNTATATKDPATPTESFESPNVGGKITICMGMFGEDHKLHRRLFTSVCGTVHSARIA